MKQKHQVSNSDLVKMVQYERAAQYHKYAFETESPLSQICESSDALGPLLLSEKRGLITWKLAGPAYYSRFRPGDRVELRTKHFNLDRSTDLSQGWTVTSVMHPEPGKIEVTITGGKPFDEDGIKEVFLFKASNSLFQSILIKKIENMPKSDKPVILGQGNFKFALDNADFRKFYNKLNEGQKTAVHQLISNDLSGAIQGPPGTGKTQLLQAVISLALQSNMKVCVTSFTNAAVDNLLGRLSRNNVTEDWIRVAEANKVKRDLYPDEYQDMQFISSTFSEGVKASRLIGCTLHKLAFNNSAPIFDLLVIDEAGQVPVFFLPFIQRLCRRLILVGDQHQLPPVLEASKKVLPVDNIFSLFLENDTPMLETQYRMRREIQSWSSEKFYKSRLVPHISAASQDYFEHHPAFLSDNFVVPQLFTSHSPSKRSKQEAEFISDKIEKLIRGRDNLDTIGVICPYRAQAGVINASLQNRFGVEVASKILVDTVERFQGQEKEAIFFSCGASGHLPEERKFISNPQRLNVAVTRAKSRFYCLFDQNLYDRSNEKPSLDLHEFLQWVKTGKAKIRRVA